jgi:hypothetical protein
MARETGIIALVAEASQRNHQDMLPPGALTLGGVEFRPTRHSVALQIVEPGVAIIAGHGCISTD